MKLCPQCGTQFDDSKLECPFDGTGLMVVHDPQGEENDSWIGRELDGRYKVDARLGAGGMGTVFKATQTAVGRSVAIKVLPRDLARDVNAVKRFMQEARAASALDHPNTVTIHDFGQLDDGNLFLVMELIDGRTLAQVVHDEGALLPERAVRICAQILNALEEAHEQGIVHRDLKPENVIVSPRSGNPDFCKVLDFGLAKMGEGGTSGGLTKTGQVFGTPAYMSPEQAKGERCDHRTDLYAVGVILYELLTGRRPFDGESPLSVLVKHMQEPPPAFDSLQPPPQDVPEALRDEVFLALAKDRETRRDSAGEMRDALLHASGLGSMVRTSQPSIPAAQHRSARASAASLPNAQHTLGSGVMGELSAQRSSTDGIEAKKSRMPLVAAAAAALLLVVGGAVVMSGGGDGQTANAELDLPAQVVRPAASPAPAAATVEAAVAEPPAAPPKPAEPVVPKVVKLGLTGTPEGVRANAEIRGKSLDSAVQQSREFVLPATLEVDRGNWVVVRFEADGYIGETVKLSAGADQEIPVALKAKPKPKPKARWRPKPKPKAQPAPAAVPSAPKTGPIDDLK
jgi:serine/threonine-protein kinase